MIYRNPNPKFLTRPDICQIHLHPSLLMLLFPLRKIDHIDLFTITFMGLQPINCLTTMFKCENFRCNKTWALYSGQNPPISNLVELSVLTRVAQKLCTGKKQIKWFCVLILGSIFEGSDFFLIEYCSSCVENWYFQLE